MTEERIKDKDNVYFAPEVEEIAYLRSEIVRQKNLSKELKSKKYSIQIYKHCKNFDNLAYFFTLIKS